MPHQQPKAGDAVFSLSGFSMGMFAIVGGIRDTESAEMCEITFNTKPLRSDVVSCGGGPAYYIETSQLVPSGTIVRHLFSDKVEGANGYKDTLDEVPLWLFNGESNFTTNGHFDSFEDWAFHSNKARDRNRALWSELQSLITDYKKPFKVLRGEHVVFEHMLPSEPDKFIDYHGRYVGHTLHDDRIGRIVLNSLNDKRKLAAQLLSKPLESGYIAHLSSYGDNEKSWFRTEEELKTAIESYGLIRINDETGQYGETLYEAPQVFPNNLRVLYS
ncbi:hypothetical protein A1QO_04140 [Vibrio genomosp. F10 str. ZF-129]|uniref:Uncharacterized protein n=1 Tax=Vibrio genomosp. F10 str. ZF-129 TaxID=1187848 RepID=A0A1E5BJ15_9VIBR|nr:hypothetical protein [Vibrio genomosp. F10]OEE37302.1 hypothetical protein A1QO_04140 [Vibrio genomosp. F10 str. ZF-129]